MLVLIANCTTYISLGVLLYGLTFNLLMPQYECLTANGKFQNNFIFKIDDN